MGAETVKYCESSLKLESHDALALGQSTASCMRKEHTRDTFALASMCCCEWTGR